jgi:hypothetical protein
MPFDGMAILGVEMLRLQRRQPSSLGGPGSTANSPIGDLDSHTRHVGSQFDLEEQKPLHLVRQHASNQFDLVDQKPLHLVQQHAGDQGGHDAISLNAEHRISTLFASSPVANTYLALHHTPLHDLLAVGGDSWVFSKKVVPATSYLEHKKRLKLWAEQYHHRAGNNGVTASSGGVPGLNAAQATVYAARAIVLFLARCSEPAIDTHAPWSTDLSDYWALYVCALICWAFGHRARTGPAAPTAELAQHQRQSSSSGGSSPATRGGPAADDEAMEWLRMVAADNMRLDDMVRVRAQPGAGGVVGLVRRRLENDCIGGRSRLYVDAVGVLRKLEEGANLKWF